MTLQQRRVVGVNLLWIVPGEVGGSEEYTVRLLAALSEVEQEDVDVILYVNQQFTAAHPEVAASFTTRVAPVSGASRLLRVITESTWLAVTTRSDGCALVHHAGGTMPSIRTAPGVITIHDLQPFANPERFGLLKRTYIRFVVPRSLRKAQAVVSLSDFVANDVVDRVGINRSLVRKIPCGVGDPGAAFDKQRRDELLMRLDLVDRPFIMYPAISYPHKNHITLVAAFAQIARDRPELRLVFTGGAGGSDGLVTSTIAAYGLDEKVVRTGRISESDLDLLYRAATVMAFPSLYEGFGLPMLEAMSRGCPVVASTAGALPEVIGDAGLLVDPVDVTSWANALGELMDDATRRTVFVRLGFARAKTFSWTDSAERLLSLYRENR